jgi:hypothetical protein
MGSHRADSVKSCDQAERSKPPSALQDLSSVGAAVLPNAATALLLSAMFLADPCSQGLADTVSTPSNAHQRRPGKGAATGSADLPRSRGAPAAWGGREHEHGGGRAAAGGIVAHLGYRARQRPPRNARVGASKIPGYAAVISGELEDALGSGWRVLTGPQEASDIAPFFHRDGRSAKRHWPRGLLSTRDPAGVATISDLSGPGERNHRSVTVPDDGPYPPEPAGGGQ